MTMWDSQVRLRSPTPLSPYNIAFTLKDQAQPRWKCTERSAFSHNTLIRGSEFWFALDARRIRLLKKKKKKKTTSWLHLWQKGLSGAVKWMQTQQSSRSP